MKAVAIADVISIATGFVLRLVAGAIAIGVVASSWLLVCGFSLALFLGFGKRRSELALAEQGRVYRPVLRAYTPSTLDSAMGITATLTLMCYMLYTIAPETRETHGTGNLIYTVPPVFYAMFRFIFKVQDGPRRVAGGTAAARSRDDADGGRVGRPGAAGSELPRRCRRVLRGSEPCPVGRAVRRRRRVMRPSRSRSRGYWPEELRVPSRPSLQRSRRTVTTAFRARSLMAPGDR